MKSNSVRRDIRSKHARGAGDAPSLGKVNRMPGTGMPKGEKRKRKRGEKPASEKTKSRKVMVWTWTAVIALGTVCVMFYAVTAWLKPILARRDAMVAEEARLKQRVSQYSALAKLERPSQEKSFEIVRQALAARDVETVRSTMLAGDESPVAIANYLKELPDLEGPVTAMRWLGSRDANGLALEGVVVNFQGIPPEKGGNRLALLTRDDDGQWKMDFAAFARTVDPSWDDFLEKRSNTATVRVYISKDRYFNGFFSDEREWLSYSLASPDLDETLFGYCKVGSDQDHALQTILLGDTKKIRATVEITRHEGAAKRQYEITRVHAQDWLVKGDSLDARN